MRRLSGEIHTTRKGFIRLEPSAWTELSEDKKKLVQEYNSRVKHGDNYKEVKFLEGVTVRHKVRRTHQENVQDDDNMNTCSDIRDKPNKRPKGKKGKKII